MGFVLTLWQIQGRSDMFGGRFATKKSIFFFVFISDVEWGGRIEFSSRTECWKEKTNKIHHKKVYYLVAVHRFRACLCQLLLVDTLSVALGELWWHYYLSVCLWLEKMLLYLCSLQSVLSESNEFSEPFITLWCELYSLIWATMVRISVLNEAL